MGQGYGQPQQPTNYGGFAGQAPAYGQPGGQDGYAQQAPQSYGQPMAPVQQPAYAPPPAAARQVSSLLRRTAPEQPAAAPSLVKKPGGLSGLLRRRDSQ